MTWLNPAAWFALVAVAAPLLIHLLVQRRAERFVFPTLRFLRPTPLMAIRRHLLEDPLLLAVRAAIVAGAVAAVAGPLVVTRARQRAWNQRVVRAIVTTEETPAASSRSPAFRSSEFRGPSIADGIRRARDWFDRSPPARRELVIAAPLAIGSLSSADLASLPSDVGIAFEPVGSLPPTRSTGYGRVHSTAGTIDREVTLTGAATSVRDVATVARASAGDALPIDVVASAQARPLVDAAIAAVLTQRVWSPPSDRRARLIVADARNVDAARSAGVPTPMEPWMADAIARITRDTDVQQAAARVTGVPLDDRFSTARWQVIAVSAASRPLVAAGTADDRLVILSGASPDEPLLPILVRALVNALAVVPDLAPLEVVRIADAQLSAWSRPAREPATPRVDAIESDDRRWLWLAVIGLLTFETSLRRSRRARTAPGEAEETARVA